VPVTKAGLAREGGKLVWKPFGEGLVFFAVFAVAVGAYHLICPEIDLKLSHVHTTRLEKELIVDTFSVSNGAFIDLKDPTIACDMKGPSGTTISTGAKTVYEVLPAGSTQQFGPLLIGTIPEQAIDFACHVESARVKW